MEKFTLNNRIESQDNFKNHNAFKEFILRTGFVGVVSATALFNAFSAYGQNSKNSLPTLAELKTRHIISNTNNKPGLPFDGLNEYHNVSVTVPKKETTIDTTIQPIDHHLAHLTSAEKNDLLRRNIHNPMLIDRMKKEQKAYDDLIAKSKKD